MGLDITAYKNLTEVKNPSLDEDGFPVNYESQWKPGAGMKWSESIWEGRGYPIEYEKVYEFSEKYEFRAGSYSGYNLWRDLLEKFKGEVAFQELINFADNEGVIGTKVSKKLATDFETYQAESIEFSKTLSEDIKDFWISKYMNWLEAFRLASENGAVHFH